MRMNPTYFDRIPDGVIQGKKVVKIGADEKGFFALVESGSRYALDVDEHGQLKTIPGIVEA